MAQPGDKVICQHVQWWNAHGDEYTIALGERLTISEIYSIAGAKFYRFAEIEQTDVSQNPGFYSAGFKSLKGMH